jgi:hypothetical protein
MSYVIYNGKRVTSGGKYVGKISSPDKIDFLNSSTDNITFSSLPDITGSKTIKARMYLQDIASDFSLAWSPASGNDYLRIDYGTGEFGVTLMVEVNYSANRRQYDLAAEGVLGVPFSLEIIKGTGTISSVKFNGIEGTNLGSSLQFGPQAFSRIRGGDHSSIWNLEIVGSHKWIGYPYGNTDAAWVDTIGSINGTVSGSPGTRNVL